MAGRWILRSASVALVLLFPLPSISQTNCEEGNGLLDFSPPKTTTVPELIRKFGVAESQAKDARSRYTYTQDATVQTLNGKSADGEFHEVTTISYDQKGERLENVMFAEQSTLRRIQLTQQDMDDIRVFMPFMLPSEDLPLYNLIYAGQQHVDDLDTYVLHVGPKKEEKNRRYFQGRIWIDSQDFQIVKVCGKSVPDVVRVKKNQPQDLRPTFVTYRQQVDGRFWFPAYTRSDDTLQFRNAPIHVREIIKYSNYSRSGPSLAGEPKRNHSRHLTHPSPVVVLPLWPRKRAAVKTSCYGLSPSPWWRSPFSGTSASSGPVLRAHNPECQRCRGESRRK